MLSFFVLFWKHIQISDSIVLEIRENRVKGGSRHKIWCMARVLSFLIRYFSNYYTLHHSDLAARAAPLDPRLRVMLIVVWSIDNVFWMRVETSLFIIFLRKWKNGASVFYFCYQSYASIYVSSSNIQHRAMSNTKESVLSFVYKENKKKITYYSLVHYPFYLYRIKFNCSFRFWHALIYLIIKRPLLKTNSKGYRNRSWQFDSSL